MRINLLETERLIIRDIRESDAHDAFRIKNDELVQKYSPDFLLYLPTYEHIREDFHIRENYVSIFAGFNEKYAICLKETGELIGIIEIYDTSKFKETQISWHFCSNHTNKGYASEASRAIVDYLFTELDVDCICATMDTNNTASYKTAEKAGFKRVDRFEWWRVQGGEVYYYMKQNEKSASMRKTA
jgi:ribosomal-protein-alanine N-acetyltransferase